MQTKSLFEFLSILHRGRLSKNWPQQVPYSFPKNAMMKIQKFGAYTIQNIVIIESLDLDP